MMDFFDLTKAEHEFLANIKRADLCDSWENLYFDSKRASRIYTQVIEANLRSFFGDIDWSDSENQDALNKYYNHNTDFMKFDCVYGMDNFYCRHLLNYVFKNTNILCYENFILNFDYNSFFANRIITTDYNKGLLADTGFVLKNMERFANGLMDPYLIIANIIGIDVAFSNYPKETKKLISNCYEIFCEEQESGDDFFSYYFANEFWLWLEKTDILLDEAEDKFLQEIGEAVKEYLE